ncbi:type II toxin-antitoxin system VapC family toxin [Marinibaculum pumilum]|uniref:Ribonuclease VapC n=1 Tax=Marinibaculum pumilum TaxID=1766165 RepID=A0ABV7L1P5_9PROT
MPYLLDTNVISETVRARPEPRLLGWLERQAPSELYLASQTIGELVRGAARVREQVRRERFMTWIEDDLGRQFEGRILPFDQAAARIWGRLMGDGDRMGQTPSAADAQIAAVAIERGLVLVTRNVRDFQRFDLALLNPWEAAAGG